MQKKVSVNCYICVLHCAYASLIIISGHMIHIKLNTRFCTHVEHSPTKTVYIKYYTNKQTNKTTTKKHHTHTHTHTHTHKMTVAELSTHIS